MPKIFSYPVYFILSLLLLLVPKTALADAPTTCNSNTHYNGPPVIVTDFATSPDKLTTNQDISVTLTFDAVKTQFTADHFAILATNQGTGDGIWSNHISLDSSGKTTFTISGSTVKKPGLYTFQLRKDGILGSSDQICDNLGQRGVFSQTLSKTSCSFQFPDNIKQGTAIKTTVTTNPISGANYTFYVFNTGSNNGGTIKVINSTKQPNTTVFLTDADQQDLNNNSSTPFHQINLVAENQIDSTQTPPTAFGKLNLNNGNYMALVLATGDFDSGTGVLYAYACAYHPFSVTNSDTSSSTDSTTTKPPGTGGSSDSIPSYPAGSPSNAGQFCDPTHLKTVIGCVATNPGDFVNQFLKFALGAAGGIALLIMAIGSIQMIAAAGNPEAVKAGRDRFVSALVGLLFIIFAVFLLQFIGVNLLNLPGFTNH